METSWILVGVDGTPASAAAVDYAAVEAWRSSATLRLVHVLLDYSPLVAAYAPGAPPNAGEERRVGHEILRAAVERAEEKLPPERVVADLLTGDRASSLVHASRGAELVVLGDHRRSLVDWIVTGAVTGAVAAHAAAPVVAVPSTWSPTRHGGAVVLGVRTWDSAAGLVRRGLEIAAERGAPLALVHAWQMPMAYDGMVAAQIDPAEIERSARRALERLLELADARRGGGPEVPVEIRVVHGQPTRVLVDESATADLILVARRPHAFPMGHLGATGRALLREAQCPVEVLPPLVELVDRTEPDRVAADQQETSTTPQPEPA